MKFQIPSIRNILNGRTNGRSHEQAESNMLPTFSKVGGIKMPQKIGGGGGGSGSGGRVGGSGLM